MNKRSILLWVVLAGGAGTALVIGTLDTSTGEVSHSVDGGVVADAGIALVCPPSYLAQPDGTCGAAEVEP